MTKVFNFEGFDQTTLTLVISLISLLVNIIYSMETNKAIMLWYVNFKSREWYAMLKVMLNKKN